MLGLNLVSRPIQVFVAWIGKLLPSEADDPDLELVLEAVDCGDWERSLTSDRVDGTTTIYSSVFRGRLISVSKRVDSIAQNVVAALTMVHSYGDPTPEPIYVLTVGTFELPTSGAREVFNLLAEKLSPFGSR